MLALQQRARETDTTNQHHAHDASKHPATRPSSRREQRPALSSHHAENGASAGRRRRGEGEGDQRESLSHVVEGWGVQGPRAGASTTTSTAMCLRGHPPAVDGRGLGEPARLGLDAISNAGGDDHDALRCDPPATGLDGDHGLAIGERPRGKPRSRRPSKRDLERTQPQLGGVGGLDRVEGEVGARRQLIGDRGDLHRCGTGVERCPDSTRSSMSSVPAGSVPATPAMASSMHRARTSACDGDGPSNANSPAASVVATATTSPASRCAQTGPHSASAHGLVR